MLYIRKPLDVEKWGRLEMWEGMDAAYILGGTEPERGPDDYLTKKATEVHQAMLSAIGIGTLKPWRKTESGAAYFLAVEIVRWANGKGFDIPKGLPEVVEATARSYVVQHEVTKRELMQKSAFSDDLLEIWVGKDLWEEDELLALLCGVKPGSFTGEIRAANYSVEQAARKALNRAIMAGTLDSIWEQEPSKYEWGKVVPPRDVQYFVPANAIRWAETKRAEFPGFPSFQSAGSGTAKQVDPIPNQLDEVRVKAAKSARELTWQEEARLEADKIHLESSSLGYRLGAKEIAGKVSERLAERDIEGPHGRLTDGNILRESLQGERWKRPKLPIGGIWKSGETGKEEK